jgi:hypothetical protein
LIEVTQEIPFLLESKIKELGGDYEKADKDLEVHRVICPVVVVYQDSHRKRLWSVVVSSPDRILLPQRVSQNKSSLLSIKRTAWRLWHWLPLNII